MADSPRSCPAFSLTIHLYRRASSAPWTYTLRRFPGGTIIPAHGPVGDAGTEHWHIETSRLEPQTCLSLKASRHLRCKRLVLMKRLPGECSKFTTVLGSRRFRPMLSIH